MSPSNLVEIDSHAAETLQYIRSSMDAATAIRVHGAAGVSMGLIGLAAMALSVIPRLAANWLGIWLS